MSAPDGELGGRLEDGVTTTEVLEWAKPAYVRETFPFSFFIVN